MYPVSGTGQAPQHVLPCAELSEDPPVVAAGVDVAQPVQSLVFRHEPVEYIGRGRLSNEFN